MNCHLADYTQTKTKTESEVFKSQGDSCLNNLVLAFSLFLVAPSLKNGATCLLTSIMSVRLVAWLLVDT